MVSSVRKILSSLALLWALVPTALAAPYDLYVSQENASGIGSWLRYVAPLSPAPNTSAVLMYNGSTTYPQMGYVGSGLSWNGTTLSASAAAQVNSDWTASGSVAEILNKPTFNYGDPVARTLAVSTVYQASDPTKAAELSFSPTCTNATTVVAASACTLQVRYGTTSGLTCGTGTVVKNWTSTYALGLLLTNLSGSPIDVKLGIGRYFILCPTAGTFTVVVAVDQTAGI